MTKFQCCLYFNHMHLTRSSQHLKYQSLVPQKISDIYKNNTSKTQKLTALHAQKMRKRCRKYCHFVETQINNQILETIFLV